MSCHVTGAFFEDSREKSLFALDDAFLRCCGERERTRKRWFSTEEASWQTLITPMFCVVYGCSARLIQPRETNKSFFLLSVRNDKGGRKSKKKKLTGKGWKKLLHILRLQIEGAELDNVCVVNTLSQVTSCLWLHLCNISLQLTVPSFVCLYGAQ